MKSLVLVACFASLGGLCLLSAKDKTIFHIQVNGSTQLSCKITRRAINNDYILFSCEYRCDRPTGNVTVDAKDATKENIYCGHLPPSPAAQGQTLDSDSKGEDDQ